MKIFTKCWGIRYVTTKYVQLVQAEIVVEYKRDCG